MHSSRLTLQVVGHTRYCASVLVAFFSSASINRSSLTKHSLVGVVVQLVGRPACTEAKIKVREHTLLTRGLGLGQNAGGRKDPFETHPLL